MAQHKSKMDAYSAHSSVGDVKKSFKHYNNQQGDFTKNPSRAGLRSALGVGYYKNEEYTGAEKVSNNPDDPSNRFIGTTSLTNNFKQATPGQSTLSTIKKVVREQLEEMSVPAGTTGKRKDWNPSMVGVRMASGKIEKHPPGKSGSSGSGNGGE